MLVEGRKEGEEEEVLVARWEKNEEEEEALRLWSDQAAGNRVGWREAEVVMVVVDLNDVTERLVTQAAKLCAITNTNYYYMYNNLELSESKKLEVFWGTKLLEHLIGLFINNWKRQFH